MAKLKTDSPLSRRIVRAFFDFLDSVEPSPGVDVEGFEVARECLIEAFQLDLTCTTNDKPGLLIDLFRSLENSENDKIKQADSSHGATPVDAPLLSGDHRSASADADASYSEPIQGDDWTQPSYPMGVSKDELFGQFFAALEKIHFFKATPDGNDDPVQVDKATSLFHDALNEMQKAGCQSYNTNSLAETLKSQGNQAMQAKLYSNAIELYSCAISLFENNAVYYCNRAAAYTHIQKYTDGIRDCLKSIEIDPNYSKAYSRLGILYYAQGNYRDAIDKGFRKALQLDPHNEGVKENIQKTEQKLKEEQQRFRWDQNMNFSSGSHDSREFNTQIPTPPSMPFNMNAVPADIANMFMNMASQYTGGNGGNAPEERRGEDRNANGSDEPGISLGGNINLNNLGESMPSEIRGALNSVMGMFSGGTAQHGSAQDTNTANGRSPTN